MSEEKIEKASEQLSLAVEGTDWEIDEIDVHDVGPEYILEANVRINIKKREE